MKLRIILWLLEILMKRALKTNRKLIEIARTHQASICFETADKKVAKQFVFTDGRLTTSGNWQGQPDLTIRFANADEGFSILTAKDKNAFLNGISRGNIYIEGKLALLLWFKAMTDALKSGAKKYPEKKETVGFVGLGMIGGPMARTLLKKGFGVKAFDLNDKALDPVISAGAFKCHSLSDLADMQIIVIMVNNMAQVEEVAFQLMEHLPPDSRATLIIMSTVSPDDVRQLRAQLDEIGRDRIGLLDAPVSGSPVLAETGGLAIYVGGEKIVFEKVRSVLEAMGDREKMFFMGELGMGAAMKLVNNIVGITVGLNVNEALYLGKQKGLDPDQMARAINAGSGKNFITENWPLARMAFDEMLKDTTHNSKGALFITGIKDLTVTKTWAEKDNIRMVGVENAIKQIEALDEEKLVTIISAIIGRNQTT